MIRPSTPAALAAAVRRRAIDWPLMHEHARRSVVRLAACEKTCARTFARSLYQRYREGRLSR